MRVNIRDDDMNFFTTPDDLIVSYGDMLGDLPITLATVPFITKNFFEMQLLTGSREETLKKIRHLEKKLSVKELSEYHQNYPIGNNYELTDFINRLRNIEIALHGIEHRFYESGAEFKHDTINVEKVRDGKEYLSKIFGQDVKVFVPPSNMFNINNLKLLSDNNMSLLTSSSIHCDDFFQKSLVLLNKALSSNYIINKLKNEPTTRYSCRDVQVITSITFKESDSAETFYNRAIKFIGNNGFLSIATHYTTLSSNPEYNREFHKFVNILISRNKDVSFCRSSELL